MVYDIALQTLVRLIHDGQFVAYRCIDPTENGIIQTAVIPVEDGYAAWPQPREEVAGW